jgi:D-aminopeptidase
MVKMISAHRGVAILAIVALPLCVAATVFAAGATVQERPRARELGIAPGIFSPGPLNAITDVAGVRVGQTTVSLGDSVNTGITVIFPHEGNTFREKVPAAIHVGNGFGKLLGVTQVSELGEIETPILLTCTVCVWKAADAMVEWLLEQDGMGGVRSINPVVGETNDGGLNAIRSRPITPAHVRAALESAKGGPVEEGSVGAGRGTSAFGLKGGIGTSSRRVGAQQGGYTVGVLIQSNFGGQLQIMGAPVGRELSAARGGGAGSGSANTGVVPADFDYGDGSIMVVVATDAPLCDRNLERLAARAIMGLSRTGSAASNGSGDYVIAFSTATEVRRSAGGARRATEELSNDSMSSLFQAVVESTEEAIYNSLTKATAVTSGGRTLQPISIERLKEILVKYNVGGR